MIKTPIKKTILLLALLLSGWSANAQRSIGVETANENPVQEYKDKKLVLLPCSKLLQMHPWSGLSLDAATTKKRPDLASFSGVLEYKKFAEKTLTYQGQTNNSHGDVVLIFHQPEYDVRVYCDKPLNVFENLAPAEDLDAAKARWLNQTIYARQWHIGTYNAESDVFHKTPNTYRTPLKVIDVWWGTRRLGYNLPVWLIVENPEGKQGYIAVRASWAGIHPKQRQGNPWDNVLFEKNPATLFPWGEEVWKNIDAGKIAVGMTGPQVELVAGKPERTFEQVTLNKKHISWQYGTTLVIFENDKVIHVSGAKP